MKIWCTKWALTQGILELEGEICDHISKDMVKINASSGYDYTLHGDGREWHRHEYDAVLKALDMIDKKFKSIENQKKNLEMDQARLRNRRDAIRNSA